jgi:catechol 2,3-dioxygenase-like lactoylglutathione lyase family enzyme
LQNNGLKGGFSIMSHGRIEHVNLTVSDAERSARLFAQLLGWHERWHGDSKMGGRTIHLGEENTYLALYSDDDEAGRREKGKPLNHVGFVVDDLAAAERVVVEAGLEPFSQGTYDPGPSSFYFFDWDGIEFEVASYA